MSPTKATQKSARSSTATNKKGTVLTAEEKSAMKELVKERKSTATKEEDASALLAKIAEMADADRAMAKRVHAIVKASSPALSPKLWYGMPAYYKDGKVVCFFQDAQKFKSRYATLGFSDAANLDEGGVWPVAWALKELTAADETKIGALVKKAVR
jgi:uncharacterized protein YdhG (YjbR/CyaY superfamily)